MHFSKESLIKQAFSSVNTSAGGCNYKGMHCRDVETRKEVHT